MIIYNNCISPEKIIFIISILIFLSTVFSKVMYKIGIPTLILFLGIGMIAGCDGVGKIYFDDPHIAQFVGTIALNFILFYGGLETKYSQIKPVLKSASLLATVGVFLTAILTGIFIFYISDFTILESILIGSIVSSTDAASVFSILRSKDLNLKGDLAPLLELESGSNDPMACILTILFLDLITSPNSNIISYVFMLINQLVIGCLLGYLLGKLSVKILNKINLDIEGLYPILTIALAFLIFSLSEYVGGNGFLSIYIAAIIIGNSNIISKNTIIRFYDGCSWLMQIILFVTLGLLVFPKRILNILPIGTLIAVGMILLIRPIVVFLLLCKSKYSTKEKLFISFVGLRGGAPIVFATYPLIAGLNIASDIFNIVFYICVFSILIQGTFLPILAKKLHLTEDHKENYFLHYKYLEDNNIKNKLFEITIKKESNICGMKILDLNIPQNVLIILIERTNQYIIPKGDTTIKSGDKLILISKTLDDFLDVKNEFYKLN